MVSSNFVYSSLIAKLSMFCRQHWPLNNKKYIFFVLKQIEIATSIKATKAYVYCKLFGRNYQVMTFYSNTFFHVSLGITTNKILSTFFQKASPIKSKTKYFMSFEYFFQEIRKFFRVWFLTFFLQMHLIKSNSIIKKNI